MQKLIRIALAATIIGAMLGCGSQPPSKDSYTGGDGVKGTTNADATAAQPQRKGGGGE